MNQLMDNIIKSVKKRPKFFDESAIDYVYRNCSGKCGLKEFITASLTFSLLSIPHEREGSEDGEDSRIFRKKLVKLTRDLKELYLAVFKYLRGTGYGMTAP